MTGLFIIVSPLLFAVCTIALGFLTPGYSHTAHTISRLVIGSYGIIQSVNMLQLSLALYLTGQIISRSSPSRHGTAIRSVFQFAAACLTIAAIVPTDPIDNRPLDLTLLSPSGLVHVGIVILFLMLSPLGIIQLATHLKKDTTYAPFVPATLIMGFFVFAGSIVWFALFFAGVLLEYRGLFQKILAVPVLVWLDMIAIRTVTARITRRGRTVKAP